MSHHGLKVRIWLVAILVILALETSCTPSGPAVKVEPPISSAHISDTVIVPIKVENITDLTAFEIHLSFDTAALEVIELNNGGFIYADFSAQNTFDNNAGAIDYAIAQIGRSPANGSGTLLEIHFRAKAAGVFPINFRETQAAPAGALLSDSNGLAIQVSLIGGDVKVGE